MTTVKKNQNKLFPISNLFLIVMMSLVSLASFFQKAFPQGYNTATTEESQPSANVLPLPSKEELKRGANEIKIPKNIKIPSEWQPYLNPATEEFWTEGNHRPDAGFVLFARNPSKDTAKLWLLRMEAKAKELQTLFPLIVEAQKDLVKQGYMVDRYNMVKNLVGESFLPKVASDSLPSQELNTQPTQVAYQRGSLPKQNDLKKVVFYFLFRPGCIHCENLSKTLVGFPNVIPLQITTEPLINFQGLAKSNYASPATVKNYDPTGETPCLIISNPKSKKVTLLKGEQSTESILFSAASVLK